MSRTVYVNGLFVDEDKAVVSIFDRGFLFADGVYEVSAVIEGRLIENERHLERLHRSLEALEMTSPLSDPQIVEMQQELIRRNNLQEGILYLQITRGPADRDFAFPESPEPTLVAFTQKKNLLNSPDGENGIKVITTPDMRWKRPDIKTVGLLASSMAKMKALEAGADDAWLLDADGCITEGSSSNAYIVTAEKTIVTRHLSQAILPGVTRRSILRLAQEERITVIERPFTREEAHGAEEAFLTGSGAFVIPVTEIDGRQIGNGSPGPLTKKLRTLYADTALEEARTSRV